MPFRFKASDKSVRAAFRRLAQERLETALTQTRDPTLSVHSLRKRIKELRGLLRLHRPVFDDFDRVNRRLRDIARIIAPARDTEVMLTTVTTLARDMAPTPADGPAPVADHELDAVIRALQKRLDRSLSASAMDPVLQVTADGLNALLHEVPGWKLNAKGFDAVAPGLEQTLARSRRHLHEARRQLDREFDATPFHEWRKHVKHHWYHARLLKPVWPAMMVPHISAADELGEVLGDHNDLDVALTHLIATQQAQHPQAVARLYRAGMLRRRVLAQRAVGIGARLFADRPETICRRWGTWWQEWKADRA